MAVVEVKGLCKSFDGAMAVKQLGLEIKKGEIYGLIGPDGAGKTTTLRILSGIMEPDSGNARVSGFKLPEEAEKVKEHIGYMPQKFSLYEDLTVAENIKFFAEAFCIEKAELEKRMAPLLKMTRLKPFANRLAGNLSGGMKQKLALMSVLIHRPGLLILDEPTTGVDPVSRRELWEILQGIRAEGVSIIVSTPYMDEAEWCVRTGIMFKGSIILSGTPSELKAAFKGTVYEIIPGKKSEGLFQKLRSLPFVSDIQVFGGRYHAVVKDKKAASALARAAGGRADIREIAPSIEDVFVNRISA